MKTYAFVMPWKESDAQNFVQELHRELANNPGHCLFERHVTLIGRNTTMDCFLFTIDDNLDENKFADVHLTFGAEKDPQWPNTQLYKTFEEFCAARMNLDAADFDDDPG